MKAIGALSLAVVAFLVLPAIATAAASYVFEPTLSLTGNCATSPLDPVPDSGTCPIPPGTVFSGSPGADHPSKAFRNPSVGTDVYGDIYVASIAESSGRIDVFSAEGAFITEIADPAGPESVAIDSEGNLYVFDLISGGERKIQRFSPTVYKPKAEEIEYVEPPVVIADSGSKNIIHLSPWVSLAVDSNDRLYVDESENVALFGSVGEENKLLQEKILDVPEGAGKALIQSASIAMDQVHKKIYVSDKIPGSSIVRIFNFNGEEVGKINGSTVPAGQFLAHEGFLRIDVDDAFSHVFVGDFTAGKVYEFEEDGAYLATIEHSFEGVPNAEIAIDDGPLSPHPQKEGWLFVPSVPFGSGHVYAFEPNEEGPPAIESTSVGDVSETEATLHATINPGGLPTAYRFEYIAQHQFEEEGETFANAMTVSEGTLPKGGEGVPVSATAEGLEPGIAYRFRVLAKNTKGEAERQVAFETFPAREKLPACENEGLRIGLSALLPDCRAYELVSPPNTNGRPPTGGFAGVYFPTLDASPDGTRASFVILGGTIPGNEGSGAGNGELYSAARGTEGWSTAIAAPSGEEASAPLPGSVSPDQTYSFWEDPPAVYIRHPDGQSELVGRGSLGEDPNVEANLMTENASHIVFTTEAGSAVQLEPNAPPAKTGAVYDRSAEGPTHVVSLLPGDVPLREKEDAKYLGASEDGEGIAFEVGGTIYLRLHNTETLEVAGAGSTFAGISEEGKRVFYAEGGDLFAYDAAEEKAIPFSESGDATPVNVASGGTRAYFVSPSILTGEPNPSGEVATEGKEGRQNLYLSEGEGQIIFVAQVTKRDIAGELTPGGQIDGLGLWLGNLGGLKFPAADSSRATPAGSTLLFESRADLTGFKSEGFAQVYRYDATEGRLDCLSCSPTKSPPTSDASLQSVGGAIGSSQMKIPSQSPNGDRAFFQTAERLVIGDSDQMQDVYEWEEEGVGSCAKPDGCIFLISGPHSASPDYLYAMSANGNDVFFLTADRLLPRDAESTVSIYDARVGGGFPEVPKSCDGGGCCGGEGCRPLTPPPGFSKPNSAAVGPNGNVTLPKRCPKGKHKVERHGKEACVKHHHKKKRHRASQKKRGGSR